MYYRDNSGIGCLIVMLIGFMCLSAFLKILFTPAFWAVVAILCVVSAIQRFFGKGKTGTSGDNGAGSTGYEYTEYRTSSSPFGRSDASSDYDVDDCTEGTNDPSRMEQVYESNAMDVDVEVIRDDK